MFGIKIISKSEYEFLLSEAAKVTSDKAVGVAEYEKLEKDCESLREQLNEKIKEAAKLYDQNNTLQREVKSLREFRRDTLEAMGQIDLAGFRLSYCTKKCSKCENEGLGCKKYQFGKHQYCVIPK